MKTSIAIIVSAGLVASASVLVAGPLSPTAGPVASTYKTLAEVEARVAINATNTPGDANSVFRIGAPGSYYLTGEAAAFPGKYAIEIAADNVSIDLNGFRVGGYPGSLGGIVASGTGRQNISVRNGMIGPVVGAGVDLLGDGALASTDGAHLADITISDCSTDGVRAADSTIIERLVVTKCQGEGIYAANACRVTDSIVQSCDQGIVVGNLCVIERCTLSKNGGHGITVGAESLVRGNACVDNGESSVGAGIYVITGLQVCIEDNYCAGNDRGIWTATGGAAVFRNKCASNSTGWVLAAGTIYGPILDRTDVVTSSVNGESANDVSGMTHPQANISY